VRTTIAYCHRTECDHFWGFSPSPQVASLYKTSASILEVKVAESEEFDGCYWAYWDNEDQEFKHIYYKKFFVEMCFPYPIKTYEESGRGLLLPVKVEVLRTVADEELEFKHERKRKSTN